MQIHLLTALAAGFLTSFRLGPLVVVPLAAAAVMLAIVLGMRLSGSTALAAIGLVVALNVGYLLGAFLVWSVGRSERLRSIAILRWLIG